MSRTVRLILFSGIVIAAWCFSSDKLLSRVAHDEHQDDAPAPQTGESDYQVVKLLSKLFTSIKRNHVEVLSLHRQFGRSQDPQERAELLPKIRERVQFVENKAREYHQLVPSLTSSYPSLKSVIQSFTRDLKVIAGDLDVVKQTDGILDGEPQRAERGGHSEAGEAWHPAQAGQPSQFEPAARPAPRGLDRGIESAHGAAVVEGNRTPAPADKAPRRDRETQGGGKQIPITLEVRGEGGASVDRRKVIFQLTQGSRTLRGFVDRSGLVSEMVAYTDDKGRATVKVEVDPSGGPLRIKRTIMPKDDHVLCRLESLE